MFSNNQKNALLKIIQERGMNKREFSITASAEPLELRLLYEPEKLHFRITYGSIGTDQNRQQVMRLATASTPKPGILLDIKAELHHSNIDKWETVAAIFGHWLALLKQEFEQPDLWTEMEQTPDFFTEQEALPEDAFTPAEIKLLEARAELIEQQLSELGLPAETEQAIAQAVREVPEKAKRLTKKEMGEILLSSVLREGFKALLTKDTMLAVWHLLMNLFTLAIGQ